MSFFEQNTTIFDTRFAMTYVTDPRTIGLIMGQRRCNLKSLGYSLRLKYQSSVWIDYINPTSPYQHGYWLVKSHSPQAVQDAIASLRLKEQHALIILNQVPTDPPTQTHTDPPTDPPTEMPIRFLILVGLPGSGKSIFSQQLVNTHFETDWYRVSQDDQSACANPRRVCETLVRTYLEQPYKRVVLDRCNPTIKDRQRWLDLNRIPSSQCACLYFDTGDADTCITRVKNRSGHPTLNPETIGEDSGLIDRVVSNFAQQIEPPTIEEGFAWVRTVHDFSELPALLDYLLPTRSS